MHALQPMHFARATPTTPPSATFGTSGTVVGGGAASVNFTQVTDPLGQAVTYSYDFNNDGTFEVAGSPSATAAVPAGLTADGPRAVAVRGRVTAADGRFADYTTQLQVANAAPTPTAGGSSVVPSGSAASMIPSVNRKIRSPCSSTTGSPER